MPALSLQEVESEAQRTVMELCRMVELKFPIFMAVRFEVLADKFSGGVDLNVHAFVPDRDTGEKTQISFGYKDCFDKYACQDICTYRDAAGAIHRVARVIHARIRDSLVHELDEMFLVCGKRLRDPHEQQVRLDHQRGLCNKETCDLCKAV